MTRVHIPALDGLRAIAVLAVLATHSGWTWAQGGWLGVDIFFVLSGYLITGKLLHPEWTFGGFMARRAARLWPALIAMLIIVGPLSDQTITQIVSVAAYMQTPGMLFHAGATGLLAHTWSLAIEVQFYVAWGAAMLAMRRWPKSRIAMVCLTLAALSALSRAFEAGVLEHSFPAYFGTPFRLDGLLVGSALAAVQPRIRGLRWITFMLGVGLAICFAGMVSTGGSGLIFGIPVAVGFTAAVVLLIADGDHSILIRGLTMRPMVWCGQRSYSLYLWHFPVFFFFRDYGGGPFVLAWLGSLIAAELSFRFVEGPSKSWLYARLGKRSAARAGAASNNLAQSPLGVKHQIDLLAPEIQEVTSRADHRAHDSHPPAR